MRFPIPVFFICFVIFMAYLAYKRSKQSQNQENANSSFLERERLANTTRKKDISGLAYLPFSFDRLPVTHTPNEKLSAIEAKLKELSEKKIINLSMYSNTDLKLMYGPANLPALSEYDDNYHCLASTLLEEANCLTELGQTKDAAAVLEYAMELGMQQSQIYLLLADLYRKQNMPEKIQSIRDALSKMDASFCAYVLPKLENS